MAIRYVGEVGQSQVATSATTITFTATKNVPAGSLIVLAARGFSTVTVTSVSDTQGNIWTKLGNTVLANTCNVWYSVVTTALTTSTVVTVTYSSASSNSLVTAWAFDGCTRPATASVFVSGATTATTLSPANLTVPQYGSLVFTAVSTNKDTTYTAPSGFTPLARTGIGGVTITAAYQVRSSMAAAPTTWSWTVGGNAGVVSGTFTPDGGDMLALF